MTHNVIFVFIVIVQFICVVSNYVFLNNNQRLAEPGNSKRVQWMIKSHHTALTRGELFRLFSQCDSQLISHGDRNARIKNIKFIPSHRAAAISRARTLLFKADDALCASRNFEIYRRHCVPTINSSEAVVGAANIGCVWLKVSRERTRYGSSETKKFTRERK